MIKLTIEHCGQCSLSGVDLTGPLKCWHPRAWGKWDKAPSGRYEGDMSEIPPWCPLVDDRVQCVTCDRWFPGSEAMGGELEGPTCSISCDAQAAGEVG